MRVRLHQPFDLAERAVRGFAASDIFDTVVLRSTSRVVESRTDIPGPDLFQTLRGKRLDSPFGRVDVWDWDVGGRDLLRFRDIDLGTQRFVRELQFKRGDFVFEDLLSGRDVIKGSSGDDVAAGFDGDDRIKGRGGEDLLIGGDDDDRLSGGRGADTLRGDRGDDRLVGGAGRDSLEGGRGADVFVFRRGGDRDAVRDFELRRDFIDLPGGAEFEDLRVVERKGDAVLILGGGDRMELRGIDPDDLAADLFI